MIGVLFTRLPDFYTAAGYEELAASRLTMFSMTAFCLVTALVVRAGLIGGPPTRTTRKESLGARVWQGIAAGRANPALLLAYACAFVGRADLVVVGTFYSLWLTQAGIASGLSADDAARAAGAMFAVVMSAALVWAPVMGWLNDRLDRTLVMMIALLLAMLGYCSMALLGDVPGTWLYPASIVLGVGQISVTLASNTLVGQESPPTMRGAVVGTFSVCGAGGILFVTSIGGRLYDTVAPAAPFVLIGILNGMLAIWAFTLFRHNLAYGEARHARP
jgi:MFS family permease